MTQFTGTEVRKYRNNPIVLDAFLQWSMNPSGKTIGYAIEENNTYIQDNLSIRYGQSAAKEAMEVLLRETHGFSQEDDIYPIRQGLLKEITETSVLEGHFVNLVSNLPQEEKKIVSAVCSIDLKSNFAWLSSPLNRDENGKKLVACINALGLDMDVNPQTLEKLLIKSGICDRILWVSARRWGNESLMIPYYVHLVSPAISRLSPPTPTYPLTDVISNLTEKKGFSELCALDEISQYGGVQQERYYNTGLPAWRGIVGKYEGYVAISPAFRNSLRTELSRVKSTLSDPMARLLDKTMEKFRLKYWPTSEFVQNHTAEEETYWKIEMGIGRPVMVILVTPWITPSITKLFSGGAQALILLTHQPLDRAEKIIHTYGSSNGVGLIDATSSGPLTVKKLAGELDSFAIEVLKELGQSISNPKPPSIPPIVEPQQVITGPTNQPNPPIVSTSQEDLVIGSKTSPKQWGIFGKSQGGKIVKFDLNAPHIIFVCGKMGSGKGYGIGVLCEMLASRSIAGISNVQKPATVIVLYKPELDKRSEFWSTRYSNDVESEVETLRSEYAVGPSRLIEEDKFRVFVDPFVYENVADKFKGDYGTQNVFPLHVDPSELEGDDWATVLSAGEKTDQLYVKQLFKIIQKRQFTSFDVQAIKADVLKSEKLTSSQQNLAILRLEMLEDYLTREGGKDFTNNLALGGINIIDFRKVIKTPDDIFSIMTLVLSVLLSKKGVFEHETFVFVINEAHAYFRGSVSEDFVKRLEFLIRLKRHVGNWLMLDTHLPDDVDEKVISLADVKMANLLDISLNSKILKDVFKDASTPFSKLEVGQTIISADQSSLGQFVPTVVNVRPRITLHGAATQTTVD